MTNNDDARWSEAYEKSRERAQKIVNEPDQLQKLLDSLEEKLKLLPGLGGTLANVPVLISIVRSYVKGEYTQFPISSLISVVGALIYFLSPVDIIPDALPVIGMVDDAAVIGIAMKLVSADVEEYKRWREEH